MLLAVHNQVLYANLTGFPAAQLPHAGALPSAAAENQVKCVHMHIHTLPGHHRDKIKNAKENCTRVQTNSKRLLPLHSNH